MDAERKAVFVTGACKNTGLTIAETFARQGYDVFLTSRSKEEAERTACTVSQKYGIFARGFALSAGNADAVRSVFAEIDQSGIPLRTAVFNAADLGIGQDTLEGSLEEFRQVFEVNVFWNLTMAREAAKLMRKYGGGALVFINSNTAYRAIPSRAAYCSSKSAVLGLSRALAVDWGKYNIRSNCVLPGMIKTDRWYANAGGQRDSLTAHTPIGDVADFEDIANAAFYLGTPLSKNVTGAEIIVDGGNSVRLTPEI